MLPTATQSVCGRRLTGRGQRHQVAAQSLDQLDQLRHRGVDLRQLLVDRGQLLDVLQVAAKFDDGPLDPPERRTQVAQRIWYQSRHSSASQSVVAAGSYPPSRRLSAVRRNKLRCRSYIGVAIVCDGRRTER